MRPETFEAFRAHAEQVHPFECFGLIIRRADNGREEYRICRNLSNERDVFISHPEDWALAEDTGKVLAVCHSHPCHTRMPSHADRAACNAGRLPWFIIGNDGLHRMDPESYQLTGRPFDFGWADCWTLARDYYGATWPDFPRVWGMVENLFMEHLNDFGFVEVGEMQPGDLLLMQVRGHGPNHLAVFLGDGQILHHAVGELSRRVPLGAGVGLVRHVLRRR